MKWFEFKPDGHLERVQLWIQRKATDWPPFFVSNICSVRLHLVALDTVAGRYECILAVVAGAARLPLSISSIFAFECSCLIREYLGVAVSAFVHAEVEFVAEVGLARFCLEKYVAGFIAFVALVALTGYGKCILAVVAGCRMICRSPCLPWLP